MFPVIDLGGAMISVFASIKKAVIFKRNFLNFTLSIINVYIVIIFHSTDNK